MELSFLELREKEIVNIYDGKRLGRALDMIFEKQSNRVLGIVVPGIKKGFLFKKTDNLFIPLNCIKKFGEDVILVTMEPSRSGASGNYSDYAVGEEGINYKSPQKQNNDGFVIVPKKFKKINRVKSVNS